MPGTRQRNSGRRLNRGAEELWLSVVRARGPLWRLLLLPLSYFYAFVSALLRQGEPERPENLRVISVGNLSAGGSGKTPLVLAVAARLKSRGLRPAVITRGYGGDEPELFKRELAGVPVFIGADRLKSARAAAAAGLLSAVMDDGFQRRHQLDRDLDILVLDWSRRDVETHCIPAGRLREPSLCALDADAVVVTHAPSHWNAASLRVGLPGAFQALKVFRGDHVPTGLEPLGGASKPQPLSWLKGRYVTALSGIGNPQAFERRLEELGARVVPRRFPDHFRYRAGDLRLAKGCEAVVCTAKDLVKLKELPAASFPVYALEMEMRVSPESEFFRLLLP